MKADTIKLKADCPRCKSNDSGHTRVIRKGNPSRHAKLPHGEKIYVLVQEFLCTLHGKFRALPDFLLPHKHYVVVIIEAALATPVSGKGVDDFCSRWGMLDASTPARWIRAFGKRLVLVAQLTERRLCGLCPGWRAKEPPGPAFSWSYAYVWSLLGHLQKACRDAGLGIPSRAHLALIV